MQKNKVNLLCLGIARARNRNATSQTLFKSRTEMTLRLLAHQIDRAANMLRGGQLVAFPTETVYGLGARADDDLAVASIFEAKKRPRFNPLIVHVADLDAAHRIARFDDTALALANAYWPGPMTLVLPLREGDGLSRLITAGHGMVAVRIPDEPIALELLKAVDFPVAAPSANPSGAVSPTTAEHVLDGLRGRIDAVLDNGPCKVGVESTILMTDPLSLLRPGGLEINQVEKLTGQSLHRPKLTGDAPTAPGQLKSHYAPNARLRLNAESSKDGELFLGFGDVETATLNLSPSGDLKEAAANLFSMLHQIDALASAQKVKGVAVSAIPLDGLGAAINDRLNRAAAPRS